jgi:hypothetical protein
LYRDKATSWKTREQGFDSKHRAIDLSLLKIFQIDSWPQSAPVKWATGKSGQCMKLNTQIHLVPSLKTGGTMNPPPYMPSWPGVNDKEKVTFAFIYNKCKLTF